MNRETAVVAVAALMTLALASPEVGAQVGRSYYRCGPNGSFNGTSCVSGGRAESCSASGCHATNPLAAAESNRVMKAACTTTPIYDSPDSGMQAIVFTFTDNGLQAIANWLCSLVTAPPPPPSGPPPPPPPAAPPPVSTVIEYHHTAFNHYFITNLGGEIAALDTGQFAGWARTGRSFAAYSASNGFVSPVCRFFTVAFPPKSSHFYTGIGAECAGLRSSADWKYEAEAFWVQPVDPSTGNCPAGSQAVYRLYNNGQSGAPNHRYTTDPAVRADMMGKGWVPEGFGPEGVGFCAPT